MIECIFTIDYEIYGNGAGSLKELVYEPTEKLITIFKKRNSRFVAFIEVAEFEMIEDKGTDQAINLIKRQIRDIYKEGFELGLHLHPQWYNGQYENGKWLLDYSEYNLCSLPRGLIVELVERAINYLQNATGEPDFKPFSFRAGNWLFQPTRAAGNVLAEQGIKVDSSVFKGGLQYRHKLDYRRALRNGYYWRFLDYVDVPDQNGILLELPIYTTMVPFWKMLNPKRIGMERQATPATKVNRLHRIPEFLRFWYPLKLDYCRMTITELIHMVDKVIQEDQKEPSVFRPVVAIGHTKDLVDLETVESFLSYLGNRGIGVSTFQGVYSRCNQII
jgi:hypothetical protein